MFSTYRIASKACLVGLVDVLFVLAQPLTQAMALQRRGLGQRPRSSVWLSFSRGIVNAARGAKHRVRLFHADHCLRPLRGVAIAVQSSRKLSAQRTAAAYYQENLYALPAREVFAQFRKGASSPA